MVADKNFNVMTLVTTIFNNVITIISWHIETLAQSEQIIQTFSVLFEDIQGYSGIFGYVQAYRGTFRHIEAYSGVIEAYRAVVRHIWKRKPCICNQPCHIQKPGLFTLEASSKAYQTYKMSMHIQSPGIVRTVYSSIFKDTQLYSGILTHMQPHSQAHN